jgi:hypothetical protein
LLMAATRESSLQLSRCNFLYYYDVSFYALHVDDIVRENTIK